MKNKSAEFDQYAADYSGGMDDPLKRLMGSNLNQFITVKVKWLLDDLQKNPLNSSSDKISFLEYAISARVAWIISMNFS